MAIEIATLNTIHGDKEMHFEDSTPEERQAIADQVLPLMQKGYSLFLIRGEESNQITGYDKEKNEWVILEGTAGSKGVKKSVPASGTKVASVGQVSGG